MGERAVIAWWGWNGRARGDRLDRDGMGERVVVAVMGMGWASAWLPLVGMEWRARGGHPQGIHAS